MEDPRKVDGLFYGGFIVLFVLGTGLAIVTLDLHPLVVVFSALIGFALVCLLGALINLAIFPPLFRLLARLTITSVPKKR
jgi:hypothetical protein